MAAGLLLIPSVSRAYPYTCLNGFTDSCDAGLGGPTICYLATTVTPNDTVRCELDTLGFGIGANVHAAKNGGVIELFGNDAAGFPFCCAETPTSGATDWFLQIGGGPDRDVIDLQYTTGGVTYQVSPLTGHTLTTSVFGYAGDDDIFGSSETVNAYGEELLWGGDDNDVIVGRAGVENLYGESGDDELSGNDGDDDIYGGPGIDSCYGDGGDDFIQGGDDVDFLWGGQGADILEGGAANDELRGEAGADTLRGGTGDDDLYGGSDNDTLCGDEEASAGGDQLYGEGGDDALWGGDSNIHDKLYGGLGADTCGDTFEAVHNSCTITSARPNQCAL